MVIRFEGVSVTRGERRVLEAVSCSLAERRIAILGPNGSGKSTFVRLINGLVVASTGRLDVDGIDPAADPKAVRRKVGFVFQNPDNQIVFPIVEEDIAFGLRNLGRSRREAAEGARAALDGFGLGGLAEQTVATLSGGERQLVALLGVLVMRPAILVFDEPTTLLDLRNRNRIAAEIGRLDQQTIVVTHDLDLVAGFDRALVLDGGRIVADDEPRAAIAWYREHMA